MLWCVYSGNKLESRRRGNSLLIYRKTIIYNYFAFKSENKHSCCLRLLIWLLKCWPFSAEWAKGTSTALRQESSSLLLRRVRWGKDWTCFQNVIRPVCFSLFHVTFYLLFNVFPTWLTLPRWTGNQSAVGLCCWRTISDMLGKFPKSFLTLLPSPASSVSCQNITLASDSKGIEVVSHLNTADSSVWKLQAGSGCCQMKGWSLALLETRDSWGMEQTLLSHLAPNLVFHPVLLLRMSEGTPTQEQGHWGITFCLLETQELLKNHLKTNCLSEMGW